jgi:2-dehydro-3-deoxygluconokinase
MRKCWGKRATAITALPVNDLGWLVEDLMMQGGVDTSKIIWREFDGLGRNTRVGLNFTEKGFGIRAALGCSDRGHSAASQIKPGEVNWEKLFGEEGVRWFHTGGIYAGLSDTTASVIEAAMVSARKHGTLISYDLNYRPSLWKGFGGQEKCQAVNRKLAPFIDVLLGNEEDFTACLGFAPHDTPADLSQLETASFRSLIGDVTRAFPQLKAVATTLRAVRSATRNDWGAIAWVNGTFHEATWRHDMEIYDRVGGGDSFASGFIYGLMELGDGQAAVEYGAAHGALAMTTPGDTSMATLAEVKALVGGGSARVQR